MDLNELHRRAEHLYATLVASRRCHLLQTTAAALSCYDVLMEGRARQALETGRAKAATPHAIEGLCIGCRTVYHTSIIVGNLGIMVFAERAARRDATAGAVAGEEG
jgi:hypothetical protein